jgi:tetratricopeptide (TPR) repeat protein
VIGIFKKTLIAVLSILFIVSAPAAWGKILISKDPSLLALEAGKHYFNKGEFATAEGYFKKASYLNENLAEAHYNLGVSLYRQNKYGEAITSMEKAASINQDYFKAHYSIGLVYFEQKNFESAISNFEKAVNINKNDANTYFDLAVSQVELFRQKENTGEISKEDLFLLNSAFENYNAAMSLSPEMPHAAENAAIVKEVLDYYSN